MIKKSFFILIALLCIFWAGENNLTKGAVDSEVYTYAYHLYFDNQNRLVADRDFNPPFDLIAQEFSPVPAGENPYRGEILSVHGQLLYGFLFEVRPGKNSVLAPYFPNARTADFYDPDGQKILSIDLAPSGSLCNENGICDKETGEDALNCPADCTGEPAVSGQEPATKTKRDVLYGWSELLAERLNSFLPLFYFWWGGIVLAALLVIFLVFKIIKRKKKNALPSPQI